MSIRKKIALRKCDQGQCGELTDKTVNINRCAKVVKGGRRFSFNALVVTGDGEGHVGVGTGKAMEVPESIRKAGETARKSMIKIPLQGTTIPHEMVAMFGPARIILKPAAPGTGIIAGSVVRSVMEAAGIKDVRTKCIGSTSPNNTIMALMSALMDLRSPEEMAALRGKKLEDLEYNAY